MARLRNVSGYDYGPDPEPNQKKRNGGNVMCHGTWPTIIRTRIMIKKTRPKSFKKKTVINSATSTASATTATTPPEVSTCRLDGSTDGILQKFDTAMYQAYELYVEGQKAYSDGFVAGCTQVGNTQLICQSFIDSSILNTKMQNTQAPTQAATPSIQQGIQPGR